MNRLNGIRKSKRLAGLVLIMIVIFSTYALNTGKSQATTISQMSKLDKELAAELETSKELLFYDVLLTFTDQASVSLLEKFNRDVKSFKHLPVARILLNENEINEVLSWKETLFIEPNRKMKLFNAEGREMTNSDEVQLDLGYTGTDVEVAIIDTGTDGLHPDVQDSLLYNWQTLGTIITNENGYVSSSPEGIDIQTSIVDAHANAGAPVNTDEYGHGTHVYGTIAGSGAASEGYYRGMAPDANIHSYSSSAGIYLVFVLEAYDHIIDQVKTGSADIRLISNSWGSEGCEFNPSNAVNTATYTAYKEGILSVFAYGNSGPDPNTCNPYTTAPYVLGIGATDKTYKITGFSSRGKVDGHFDREAALENFEAYVNASAEERAAWDYSLKPLGMHRPSVSAPGANIVSAQNPAHPMTATGTYYGAASGTSMATPMVTGVLALVIDAFEQNNNGQLNPIDLIRLIEVTANKEIMYGYQEHDTGAGFIDAKAAVERAIQNNIPEKVTEADLVSFELPENVVAVGDAYKGTVPLNSWQTNEGYQTHTFEVKEGALKAYVDLSWNLELENLYLSLYAPGTDVTDTSAATAQSAGLLDTTNKRFVEVNFPEPGIWTIRIDGRNNTVTDYTGNWNVYYEEESNKEPKATLNVTPDKISGNETVEIHATVSDQDGYTDLKNVSLVVQTSTGKVLYNWTEENFFNTDQYTLTFKANDLKMSGKGLWTVTLRAEDSSNNKVIQQAFISKK